MENIVYVYEHWSGEVTKAKIEEENDGALKVNFIASVDRNGKDICPSYGTAYFLKEKTWTTFKEAWDFIDKKRKNNIIKYSEEIVTIEDLLNFPLKHCFCGEEYTNYEAIEAYKKRCKELTNIEIK